MRFHVAKIGVFSALLVGGFTACSKDGGETDTSGAEDCGNGMDDDGDGLVDSLDTDDCGGGGDEETECDDGDDNDGDGDADCDDDDCEFEDACVESDCSNGDDDDGDGDVDCDDRDCNGEDECEFFEPTIWSAVGGFGYDADSGNVVGAVIDGNPADPWVAFRFMTEDYWSGADPNGYCTVAFTYNGGTGMPLETFTGDGGEAHGGFSFDLAAGTNFDTLDGCTAEYGINWDTDSFGGTAEEYVLASLTVLGVGVGEASSDVQTAIEDYIYAADQPYWGGGGIQLGDSSGAAYAPIQSAFGCEVDGSWNVPIDGEGACTRMTADSWADGSGVPPTGYYYLIMFSGWYL